jgi:hypothetical protein
MDQERIRQVLAGSTVVANIKTDKDLVEWAKARGLYLYIGRRDRFGRWEESPWHNPYHIGRHGTRDEVCDKYRDYLMNNADLMSRLDETRGKVLGCWCYPERCHGEEIIRLQSG